MFHARVDRENVKQTFSQETLTTIFSNLKSIYKFHAEFLLPQVNMIRLSSAVLAEVLVLGLSFKLTVLGQDLGQDLRPRPVPKT